MGGGGVGVTGAWVCLAAFGARAGPSFQFFWSRQSSLVPIRPATTLVVSGPYRWTRNPMYVGMALLTLGAALWRNTWWIVVLLAPALLAIDRLVIAREEKYLRRRFGSDYEAYVRRVRRWL